ncbi:UV-endonuclease UvdE-domain-containing protein [Leucosporidium creatinivorum]|uniref:UV-endonuclease UvdE-domain-containing protein n=1 Tax=Leucosporidium creatinivorum TaxID=106004 RepID=A0A1Y2ENR6_9BASI|nr:UV-endonuclease UvdE-domain-containing protein [Leucosporidium creatinivorum]
MIPNKRGRSASPFAPDQEGGGGEGEGEGEATAETPVKKKRAPRKMKPKEPVVYVIPEVEKRVTTYRGRLGYACLNTILRKEKPSVFCSRTCRIDSIKKNGMDFLKELGRQNMADLHKLILWNASHHIFFMRMSSEMFPFAAHPDYAYSLEYAEKELKEAGQAARELGVRLTTHPGQFTQLGSPKSKVVENAIRDLEYHNEMMDRMGLDKDSVMIIHGGGVYGDKKAALARFKENYEKLSEGVKARLVLENDEICYNVDDLLPTCEELNIPLVFDYHHDWIYPSSQTPAELMPRILATWSRKGIKVKQHLSEPRKGAETIMERRAHADRCQRLPDALPDDVDLMIEAKDKEQAVFHLFRIYDLKPTIHDDLRPPALEETKQTAGRKSRTPKKKKDTASAAADEEGAGEGMEDPEAVLEEGAPRIEDEGEVAVDYPSLEGEVKPPQKQRKKRMTKKEKEALETAAKEAAELEKGLEEGKMDVDDEMKKIRSEGKEVQMEKEKVERPALAPRRSTRSSVVAGGEEQVWSV